MPGRATWDVAWANKAEAGGTGETAVLTKWGDRTGFKRTVNVHLRDDDDLVEGVPQVGGSGKGSDDIVEMEDGDATDTWKPSGDDHSHGTCCAVCLSSRSNSTPTTRPVPTSTPLPITTFTSSPA